MIIVGVICLLIGLLTGIGLLWTIGLVLLVIGVVLWLLSLGAPTPAPWYRRRWY